MSSHDIYLDFDREWALQQIRHRQRLLRKIPMLASYLDRRLGRLTTIELERRVMQKPRRMTRLGA